MTSKLALSDFFDISQLHNPSHFEDNDLLKYLGKSLNVWLEKLLDTLSVGNEPKILGNVSPNTYINGRVYIAEGAKIEPTAFIEGPCYIGPGTEVRHGAYIRGNTYAGEKCVIGHATETKGAVFLDEAKAGHFAYVGDSILGRNVNLGAGTKLANLKLRKNEVKVLHPKTGEATKTGLRKFGAIMGDGAQTGCNAVLSPGTLLLPQTAVFPCVHYHGTLREGFAS